jgi:hypothetical protein
MMPEKLIDTPSRAARTVQVPACVRARRPFPGRQSSLGNTFQLLIKSPRTNKACHPLIGIQSASSSLAFHQKMNTFGDYMLVVFGS